MSIEQDHPAEYDAWINMIHRCHNPSHFKYSSYGLRGIRVCSQWRYSFSSFLSDIGPRPDSAHSLDRIDNNKGYQPDNVRWATLSQQNSNRRHWKWHQHLNIPAKDIEAIRSKAFALWQQGALDTRAAKELGIDPKTLHRMMKEFTSS
jgi:hypothetical protein